MAIPNYEVITPPFPLNFAEMSRSEIKQYALWFFQIAPTRKRVLTTAIRSKVGFEDWDPDFTPESLDTLGEWLSRSVSVRPRTNAEVTKIYQNAPGWFKHVSVPEVELTDETFSIAMDVGMYFAEVLVRHHPWLEWKVLSKNNRDADYGQPVLTGFGGPCCNAVRIAVTLAYSFADQTQRGSRLRELYETWSNLARSNSSRVNG